MKKQQHSIDGFVPRRSGAQVGGLHASDAKPAKTNHTTLRELHTASSNSHRTEPARRQVGIKRSEIDESLKGIDAPSGDGSKKQKRRKSPEQKARRRKVIKRVALLLIVILVAVGGYVGVRALMASDRVLNGNILDVFQNKPLQQDSNGRSNILVLGTSDDDANHGGADLTDSMMILSVDQKNKNAYLVSIPRDLYVKFGRACNSGYAGKINEYYNCIKEGDSKESLQAALKGSASFIGDIFGMDIQYGVNLNHTVIRQLVSAVGGITVNIQSRNPNGVLDSNFDWKCGVGDRKVSRAEQLRRCPPSGHFIDFPNGEVNMDAEHALYFTMARGDRAPTYGLEQSNFDREKNQQLVIKAIQEKATSAGTLSNIGKVTSLIDAVGDNLRSTFETAEIRTLVDLGNSIKQDDIQSLPFNDEEKELSLMSTGNAGGMSIVQPSAGLYNYTDLRAYLMENLSNNPITKEKASVVVLNGSGVAGAAQTESTKLQEQGIIVSSIANAPAGDYGKAKIYQITTDKTATAAKLKEIYGAALLTTEPPVAAAAGTDFIIIIGAASTTGTQ